MTSKHPEACLLLAVHAKTVGGNAASSRLRTRITELQLLPDEPHLPLQIAAALLQLHQGLQQSGMYLGDAPLAACSRLGGPEAASVT